MVRVVIVDNHPRRGALAKSYYESQGCKPALVNSIGDAALEIYENCPDLLLLAHSLPDYRGEARDDFSVVRLKPESLNFSMIDAYFLLAYGRLLGIHCDFSGPFTLN